MNLYLNELGRIEGLFGHYIIPFFMKVIGAFALWIFAGFVIRATRRVLVKALDRKKVDPTLITYAGNTLGFGLKGLTLIVILEIFGVQTTSFSAILAAAGVAIGVAWSGLLSNFAAGVFLILFRPFKIGDSITAGGVTGVVREIGLFATRIDSAENLRFFVGNNKLFSDNILNFSANPYRYTIFKIQLAHSVDPLQAIEQFSASLAALEGAIQNPPVSGEIVEFNTLGTLILIRVACAPARFAALQNEGNRVIARMLRSGNYPIPELRTMMIPSSDRSQA